MSSHLVRFAFELEPAALATGAVLRGLVRALLLRGLPRGMAIFPAEDLKEKRGKLDVESECGFQIARFPESRAIGRCFSLFGRVC